LSQLLKKLLTIHFEEDDFADTGTNVIFGLAQEVSLRLLADLLEENGSVGK